VRGVNFQPVQGTGRNEGFVPEQNRIVLSEIRRAILDQWRVFGEAGMIPLPCNPEAISIGYGLRGGSYKAITMQRTVPGGGPDQPGADPAAALVSAPRNRRGPVPLWARMGDPGTVAAALIRALYRNPAAVEPQRHSPAPP
jgi:hypothetical protein